MESRILISSLTMDTEIFRINGTAFVIKFVQYSINLGSRALI